MDTKVFDKVLLNKSSFKDMNDVTIHNFPNNSGIVYNYGTSYWFFAEYYRSKREKDNIDRIIEYYKENLMVGLDIEYEKRFLEAIQKLKN
jgi:hypothetical protein